MIRRLISRDSVALTGSVIGLVSLWFGWLTLKPNRLANGTSFGLWEVMGQEVAAAIILLWLVCLVFSRLGKQKTATHIQKFRWLFYVIIGNRITLEDSNPGSSKWHRHIRAIHQNR